jgi:multiple antibiotic resistance protein
MDTTALIRFATAMFAILNPIGCVAIFAGLTADRSPAARRATAFKAAIGVGAILVGSVWSGEALLDFFGIDVASLQVAGGVMIALISLSMLRSQQSPIHSSKHGMPAGDEEDGSQEPPDIAVVPLAMPIVAGPGAIVTVIVNTHKHGELSDKMEMSIVCAALAALICVCLLATGLITRVLGHKGLEILTKFMGMLLLAIAVGMLADGVVKLLPGLAN